MAKSTKARERIDDYLKKQHVLTLAVFDGAETWCASCFYVFDGGQMSFMIMTEVDTRHGAMMLKNHGVSGTVVAQPRIIAHIRGFQFSGSAILLEGDQASAARKVYCRRFPTALASDAPIWRIDVESAKLTDNTLGFGTKIVWQRSTDM